MALRNRTALTNMLNQENTKNVKLLNGVAQPMRRAALGEIGNKVNTVRGGGGDRLGKEGLALKAHNKPISKNIVQVDGKFEKVADKPPVQIVKLLIKKDPSVETKAPIQEPASIVNKKELDAFSSDLLGIEDIDGNDKYNPILVATYCNDIYSYLRQLEKQFPISKGFLAGQEVTPKMRCVLVDWLVEVHQQFHLLQETLFLTIAVLDRFLESYSTITRKRLQLVGVAAMFFACKYEEMYSPDISDFVYITDNAYSKMEILQMEKIIAKTLNYSLGRPLPLHFLRRYSRAGRALPVHHTMAKYFLEQSLIHYELSHYPPSLIAAAALYLSFFIIGHEDDSAGRVIWTNTLAHYSTYKKEELLPVVHDIAAAIVSADKSKYQAVRKKYTQAKHMKISLRAELKSPSMLALANLETK